jgi:autotransporter-associated beta strand protein
MRSQTIRLNRRQIFRSQWRPALAMAAAAAVAASPAYATDRSKADNSDNLNLQSSWLLGTVPTASDAAVWDSAVTGANTVLLGADLAFGGLRIANPAGAVTIGAGNTLTLGSSGIDMAAASQDLTIGGGVTTAADAAQAWNVATGRTLTLNGAFTRTNGSAIRFASPGTIKLNALTGGAVLTQATTGAAYAVITDPTSGLVVDWAGVHGTTKNVQRGDSILTYNVPTAPDANTLASFSGTITGPMDVQQGSGVRLTANGTVTGGGIRFNTNRGGDWTLQIDSAASGRVLTTGSLLVTENVGANNVIVTLGAGGTGGIRPGGNLTGGEIIFHQYNTQGSLILNTPINANGSSNNVTKTGPGRMIIGVASTAAGVWRILDGSLQIGNNASAGAIGATATVLNNGDLSFRRTDAFTFSNNISGPGTVTFLGGTTTPSGTPTYIGATNFNGGVANMAALSNFGNSNVLNFNGGTLQYGTGVSADISAKTVTISAGGGTINTNGNNVTFANAIGNGGAGALTKIGSGTLTLTGTQTYTGGTIVSGGTLAGNASVGALTVGSGANVAPGNGVGTIATSALTLNSGAGLTFEFGGGNDQITSSGALTIDGGAITLYQTGTTTPFSTAGTYSLLTHSGVIGGAGISALSVANPLAGYSYNFSDTGSVVRLQILSTGVIAQWLNAAGGSWGTGSNWSTNPTIPNSPGATANFTTALSGDATVTLDGNRTIGGAAFSSASGNYTIAQGTGGSLIIDNNGTTAHFSNLTGNHTISAPVVLNSTLSVEPQSGSRLTVSGLLSGAGGIANANPGTLVLNNSSNTYAGGTSVTAGTLEFNGLGALGTGNVTLDGGTLRHAAGRTDDVSARLNPLGASGGAIDTNGNNVSFATAVGGVGAFTKAGAGTLTFTANNTYTGATTINGGTLSISGNGQLGDPATGAVVNINNAATLAISATTTLDNAGANTRAVTVGAGGGNIDVADTTTLTVAGAVTGGELTKVGAGTLTVSNTANTAPFVVAAGSLRGGATAASNGGFGTGAITLKGGANVSTNMPSGSTLTFGNALTVPTNATGTLNPSERFNWLGSVSGAGELTVNVNTTQDRMDFTNNWSGFTGKLNITGSSSARLMIQGGTGGAFASGGLVNTAVDITPAAGASLTVAPRTNGGGNTINIGALSGSANGGTTATLGGSSNNAGSPNWSIGSLNTSTTFAGTITGNSSLTKVGIGTLTLSGPLNYTGATTVSTGTLKLTGTDQLAASPSITVAGTLDVSAASSTSSSTFSTASGQTIATGAAGGTILGNFLHDEGTVSPGGTGAAATLTAGNNFDVSGGTIAYSTSTSTASGNDLISVGGTSSVGGAATVNIDPSLGISTAGSYTVLHATGGVTGDVSSWSVTGLRPGSVASVSTTANDVKLSVTSVAAASLNWAGTVDGTTASANWDNNLTNWYNGAAPGLDKFYAADAVNFGDTYDGATAPLATTITLNTTVAPSSVTVNSALNYSVTGSGKITGTAGLTKSGTGTLTLSTANDYTGPTIADGGTVVFTRSLTTSSALNVSGTGKIASSSGGGKVFKTNAVTATGGGSIDLADNRLIVANASAGAAATTAANLTALLKNGFNGGQWNGGAGIVTSRPNAGPATHLTALAVAVAGDVNLTGQSWAGQTLAATDAVVMYTYGGDADLNGKLDGDDYFRIDSNINIAGASGWTKGDFDYNGVINGDDYFVLDSNIGRQGAQITFAAAGGVPTGLTETASVPGIVAVPEPASLGALVVAMCGAVGGRRRRRQVQSFAS